MKQSKPRSSILLNLILFTGLVVMWGAFAPVNIGGWVSYVMVNGISMEPNYHTGDLVIVRKAQTYQIGDVVTYRDPEMGEFIIHRIVSMEQERFVIKGDNNSWLDAYHPDQTEIVGKQWIYAPKAGEAMLWLRKPINLSLIIILLGGVFMSNITTKPSRNKKGKNNPSVKLGGMLEGTVYLFGFLFLAFLGLFTFAFTRPSTRIADTIPYEQDGSYSYSATGTPGVYDTAMVRSGEPVFPRLACFLNIGHTYSVQGNQLQNVSGSQQMFARVMDEPSGWQRTIPLLPQTAFIGSSYASIATLDLCQLETMVNLVEQETGLRTNTYTVEIITNITFTATTSGQPISGSFDPTLAFKYDKVHLYLANTNNEIDPLHITKKGIAGSSIAEINTLSFFGWEPTVGSIRIFALIGLGISIVGLGIMGMLIFNIANQGEDALIRLRYGSILVDVYEKSLEPSSTTIDVTSIGDLAKLAERQGSMILHMTLNFLHYYLVQSNGTTYRYMISTGKKGVTDNHTIQNQARGYMPFYNEEAVANNQRQQSAANFFTGNGHNAASEAGSIRNNLVRQTIVDQKDQATNLEIPPRKAVTYPANIPNNKNVSPKLPHPKMLEYVINTGEIAFVATQPETQILRKFRI